jgi:CheY-like chemotaxis protein
MITCEILIVDEDTDDIEILTDAFKSNGVESVHYVHTAMQAFTYLQDAKKKEELPKLIITDLFLPGITGLEFLTGLKIMEPYKHIQIFILSSSKQDKEIEKYRQMGAVDYLVKPTTYNEYVKVAADIKSKIDL